MQKIVLSLFLQNRAQQNKNHVILSNIAVTEKGSTVFCFYEKMPSGTFIFTGKKTPPILY